MTDHSAIEGIVFLSCEYCGKWTTERDSKCFRPECIRSRP